MNEIFNLELVLWRHASAEHYRDRQRALDARGHQQAQASGAWLQQHYPNCSTWASEALRSQETAKYYREDFIVKPALNPAADEDGVFQAIQHSGEASLIVVGHQMWIGALAARLAGDNRLLFFGHSQMAVFAFHQAKWRLINSFVPEL